MDEIWKNIVGYHGYMASNLGRIKSFLTNSNGRILKERYDKDGYKMVWTKHRAGARVHQLVLLAFEPEGYFDGAVVNHKNGNKEDNKLSNLEWATISENTQHAYDTGLAESANSSPVLVLHKDKPISVFKSINQLSQHCKIDRNSLSDCILNKREIFDELFVQVIDNIDPFENLLNCPFCFNPLERYQSQPLLYNNLMFESIKKLSEYLSVDRGVISRAIKSQKTIKGFNITKITRYEYISNRTSTTNL